MEQLTKKRSTSHVTSAGLQQIKKHESTVVLGEDGNAGEPVNVDRDTLVEFRCKRGGRETKEQYQVIGVFCK